MSNQMLVAFLFAALVIAVSVAISMYFTRRDKRRRREEDIREVAKRAREEERRRIQRVKRIARQDKIGDRMFGSLFHAWKMAGEPEGSPRRIRHNFGAGAEAEGGYYIEVGGVRDAIDAKVWISIDLRRVGHEVSFTGGPSFIDNGYREYSLADVNWYIPLVLTDKLFRQAKTVSA
jgi:hypothetical protein